MLERELVLAEREIAAIQYLRDHVRAGLDLEVDERRLAVFQLVQRRQLLLKRADVAKVLNLSADARSYWLYTNTPIDNERVTAVFREYGFEAGLDRLAASA